MPLRTITGFDAIANLRGNPYAEWPGREPADANRIEPYGKPAFSPSFKLEPGEKIFTIGSCFARNIERALAKRGFDVVTLRLDWPDKANEAHVDSVLNNYGVVSMENEFRWALDPGHPFDPAAHIFQLAPERYLDPHLAVRPSRVIIMTLGLSELWFDKQTQTYLNLAPPRGLVASHAERFEIHLLSFEETLKSLNAVIALLKKYCRPDLRILLTVSPVPMNTTHTDQDVLVVNTYSKSVLRTAAEHIAAANPHIDYFPSYESVILSDHARSWQDDQVHVRDPLILLNVERMLQAYMHAHEAPPLNVKLILRNAKDEIAAHDLDSAARALEPLHHLAEIDPDFANDYVPRDGGLRPGQRRSDAGVHRIPGHAEAVQGSRARTRIRPPRNPRHTPRRRAHRAVPAVKDRSGLIASSLCAMPPEIDGGQNAIFTDLRRISSAFVCQCGLRFGASARPVFHRRPSIRMHRERGQLVRHHVQLQRPLERQPQAQYRGRAVQQLHRHRPGRQRQRHDHYHREERPSLCLVV
jgi:hypothetical protein